MAVKLPQGEAPLEDLLLRISWKEDDRADAEKAFSQLYQRYNRYVRFICSKFNVNKYTDSDMQQTIFNNVFNMVFQKAEKLLDFQKGIDEKQKDLMFKCWLGKTARSFFNRILTERKRTKIIVDYATGETMIPQFIGYEEIMDKAESCETEEPFISNERAQLDLALMQMPEKNREITFAYLTMEDEHGTIPTDIRKSLAKAFGVLPDTLRKIKQRTIESLIKKLNPKRVNVLK